MRRLREYPGVSMKTTLNQSADPRAPAFSRFLALERSVGIRARRVCTNFPSFNIDSYSVHSSPTLSCVDLGALPKKSTSPARPTVLLQPAALPELPPPVAARLRLFLADCCCEPNLRSRQDNLCVLQCAALLAKPQVQV